MKLEKDEAGNFILNNEAIEYFINGIKEYAELRRKSLIIKLYLLCDRIFDPSYILLIYGHAPMVFVFGISSIGDMPLTWSLIFIFGPVLAVIIPLYLDIVSEKLRGLFRLERVNEIIKYNNELLEACKHLQIRSLYNYNEYKEEFKDMELQNNSIDNSLGFDFEIVKEIIFWLNPLNTKQKEALNSILLTCKFLLPEFEHRKNIILRKSDEQSIRNEVVLAFNYLVITNEARVKLDNFYKEAPDYDILFKNNKIARLEEDIEKLEKLYNKYEGLYSSTNIVNQPISQNIIPINQLNTKPTYSTNKLLNTDSFDENSSAIKNRKEQLFTEKVQEKISNSDLINIEKSKITAGKSEYFKTANEPQKVIIKYTTPKKSKILSQLLKKDNLDKRLVGELGEIFVFNKELQKQNLLSSNNIRIIHASKESGDGLGYDIQSVDENLNPIYIEVKTSINNENSSFYISSNEYEKFNTSKDHLIYRVVNFSLEKKEGDIIKIKSPDELHKEYEVIPHTYIVRMKES